MRRRPRSIRRLSRHERGKNTKNNQISNFMKILSVAVQSYHADGQTEIDRWTDKMKLIVAFRNFANAPKRESPLDINFPKNIIYLFTNFNAQFFIH
jgi:hypothetical protein